jgi:hypothetical protein
MTGIVQLSSCNLEKFVYSFTHRSIDCACVAFGVGGGSVATALLFKLGGLAGGGGNSDTFFNGVYKVHMFLSVDPKQKFIYS